MQQQYIRCSGAAVHRVQQRQRRTSHTICLIAGWMAATYFAFHCYKKRTSHTTCLTAGWMAATMAFTGLSRCAKSLSIRGWGACGDSGGSAA